MIEVVAIVVGIFLLRDNNCGTAVSIAYQREGIHVESVLKPIQESKTGLHNRPDGIVVAYSLTGIVHVSFRAKLVNKASHIIIAEIAKLTWLSICTTMGTIAHELD
jgi:hypothetical protein